MDHTTFGQYPPDDVACGHRMGHMNRPAVNVGDAERAISTVAGGLALLYGISRLSTTSLVALVAGGALIYRGLSGHCDVYAALGMSTADDWRGNSTGETDLQYEVAEPSLAATNEAPPISR